MEKIKSNYQLLDCGNFEKLEKFGNITIRRPALQACWEQKLSTKVWNKYDAKYDQVADKWTKVAEDLPIFECNNLLFELRFSSNRQIGIFPEQFSNWEWIQQIVTNSQFNLNILNGFAYTGASTIFASNQKTKVTHLDASSSSVKWAKQNSILSGLQDNQIRWIVDDITTFLTREIKRREKYDGIIIDPPAFGRGKKGTSWKLGRDLPKLVQLIDKLMSENPVFIILSAHDNKFGITQLHNELQNIKCLKDGTTESFELLIESKFGNNLPAGNCVRWKSNKYI